MKKEFRLDEGSLIARSPILTGPQAERALGLLQRQPKLEEIIGDCEMFKLLETRPCKVPDRRAGFTDGDFIHPLDPALAELPWSVIKARLGSHADSEIHQASVKFGSVPFSVPGSPFRFQFCPSIFRRGVARSVYTFSVRLGSSEPPTEYVSRMDPLSENPEKLQEFCALLKALLDKFDLNQWIRLPDDFGKRHPLHLEVNAGPRVEGFSPAFVANSLSWAVVPGHPAGAVEIKNHFGITGLTFEEACSLVEFANAFLGMEDDPVPEEITFHPLPKDLPTFIDWIGGDWGGPWLQDFIMEAVRPAAVREELPDWTLQAVGMLRVARALCLLSLVRVPGGWRFHVTADSRVSRKRADQIRAELAAIMGQPEGELWEPLGPRGGWLGVPQW